MNELDSAGSRPLRMWQERLENLRRIEREVGVNVEVPTAQLEPDGNILWMLEIEEWRSALHVMGGNAALTCAIANHFEEVVYLDSRPSFAELARRRLADEGVLNATVRVGDPRALPYADASFDWIAAQDALDAMPTDDATTPWDTMKGILTECRRVLRPGGGLYVRAANRHDLGTWLPAMSARGPRQGANGNVPGAAVSARWLRNALRDAGFSDVRLYYVEPTRALPMALIPATRKAVAVYESRGHLASASARFRRLMAGARLHASLYSALVALAYL
ncbi:MAG: class I SAM-dependent methyltransferase [Gemmatimonadaceae bacterium]